MNHPEINADTLSRMDTVLASVLDSLFDGVYIVDRKRLILFWNEGAERITGYSRREVIGRSCSDDILNHIDENGEMLCRGRCPLLRTLQTGEEITARVYPKHASGRRFPVETNIAPLRDADGNIIAAIEVFRDISQEEDFRILQEKFNRIVQKYVSISTYEEMVNQTRSERGTGSRARALTIFYLDIVGFTPLSERHPPEEVVEMLNDVFSICDVITRERHGDIDKFIGDALLATFIDAGDAVSAGMDIQRKALPAFNALRRERGQEAVRVRIGINSGNVIQGDVGTSERKDLTVIGDVVNTAERIQRVCNPDTVLISESAYSRLDSAMAAWFEYFDAVTVKGKAQPVRLFRLKAAV